MFRMSSERWIVTGLSWAAVSFLATLAFGLAQGDMPTAERMVSEAGRWAAAGLAFGQAMRLVGRHGAGRAGGVLR